MKIKKGQSLAEYVIVAGLIALALVAMSPAFRRSVQKVVKSTADIIGFQHEAEQASEPDEGFLNYQITNVKMTTNGTEHQASNVYVATEAQTTVTNTATLTNGAFVNE